MRISRVHHLVGTQDLATLVSDQGHMVDDIADHIERTADHTRDATAQLQKARPPPPVPFASCDVHPVLAEHDVFCCFIGAFLRAARGGWPLSSVL